MQQAKGKIIPRQKLYLSKGTFNIPLLKQAMAAQSILPNDVLSDLLRSFQGVVKNQPNLIKLTEPTRIIGDVHGQFYDVLKIISLCPSLEQNKDQKLLFLGDYVDRGIYGTQVIILLFAMKVNYPKQVFLLRGNHQSRLITQTYNFFLEFTMKYSQDLYFDVMDCFDLLPLACIVNDKYFCVHAGISPEMIKWDKIQRLNEVNRFAQVPTYGEICDYLWSDPVSEEDGSCMDLYEENKTRGCSIYYGAELAQKFLKRHKLHMIVRAHQIINTDGYKKHIWPGWNDYPTVITIFSAPNYCGTHQNKGVILSLKNNRLQLRQLNQQSPINNLLDKTDLFSLTFMKLISDIDKFSKNLTRTFCRKHFNDYKSVPEQTKIAMMLQYDNPKSKNCRNLLSISKKVSVEEEAEKNQYRKQLQQSYMSRQSQTINHCFRSSISYFAHSQKMPDKKIYMSSVDQLPKNKN